MSRFFLKMATKGNNIVSNNTKNNEGSHRRKKKKKKVLRSTRKKWLMKLNDRKDKVEYIAKSQIYGGSA